MTSDAFQGNDFHLAYAIGYAVYLNVLEQLHPDAV